MREIVVSMQNTLLSEAVARSLAETGEFRVEQVLPGMRQTVHRLSGHRHPAQQRGLQKAGGRGSKLPRQVPRLKSSV